MALLPGDIADIERATVAALAPERVEEIDGWLLPMDRGTVSRVYSAVPLSHAAPDSAALARIEALYRNYGRAAVFRLPVDARFAAMQRELAALGYAADRPVCVQVAPVAAMLAVSTLEPAQIAQAPDAAWAALFLGEGFDPVDGASRVQSLSRAAGSLFASVRDERGTTVAGGALGLGHGWASVHGMRTALDQRGRGLAGRVLRAMAQAAAERGITRVALQVDQSNAPALALYARAGFNTAWTYEYWRPPLL